MKKLFKKIRKISIIVFVFLMVYLLSVWLVPFIAVNKHNRLLDGDVKIFLKSNGVHIDVVVPVKTQWIDWSNYIKYTDTDAVDSTKRYVAIGWGDKEFYLNTPEWKDLKISTALKAAFHLGSTAMHTNFFHELEEDSLIRTIFLSGNQYKKMAEFILSSFKLDTEGRSINIPSKDDGYGENDAFYEAKGSYDLFTTCNTWVNNVLKAGGQRACLWTVTANGIMYHYRKPILSQ